MKYEEGKLDKMFEWLTNKLAIDTWFPEGEKKLTEDQAIYIEELMSHRYPILEGLEFNHDFTRIRKADLTGFTRFYQKQKIELRNYE